MNLSRANAVNPFEQCLSAAAAAAAVNDDIDDDVPLMVAVAGSN